MEDDPRIRFATTEEFAAWIETHGEAPGGVWLMVPRAGSELVGIS